MRDDTNLNQVFDTLFSGAANDCSRKIVHRLKQRLCPRRTRISCDSALYSLVGAVFRQAIIDAQDGNDEAELWLYHTLGHNWRKRVALKQKQLHT